MDSTNENKMFNYTLDTLNTVAKLPIIRVDREDFLRKQFSSSPYIEQIIQNGPQSVYTVDSIRKKGQQSNQK